MDVPLKIIISIAITIIVVTILSFMIQNQLGGAESLITGILGF
ncbi:MAG: hypothetical protein ABEJ83_05400 [Candidatus Nanohaloarchaea archaeon]